ncbi:hypothetical protein SeMB42_g04146 [Synchytrium endobioticum]|uniref:AAA+ ATPase domain-containing protein n=1 Tax=Synchytrium endobioticum TaxID=286115 RepID=A0A507D0N1_9FUNG|nr:hypothetical protein SeMB42_g04146 [Synchytrium endobioticum]
MSKKKAAKSASSSSSIPSYPPPPTDDTYRVVAISSTSTRISVSQPDVLKLRGYPGESVIITPNSGSSPNLPTGLLSRAVGAIWPDRHLASGFINVPRDVATALQLQPGFLVSLHRPSPSIIPEAEKVIIKQTSGIPIRRIDVTLESYIRQMLVRSTYLCQDQRITVTYEATERVFRVESIQPDISDIVAYSITNRTLVTVKAPLKGLRTSINNVFSHIGGLDDQIRQLNEFVDLTLRTPERYTQFGFLLHGSSGTGKTLVAKSIAQSTGAYVVSLSGSDIVSSHYGETEAKLRQVFEDASANSPSIVLLDDVEALCPRRDGDVTEAERRAVATMLTLLDGISSKSASSDGDVASKVIVIGTTSRIDALDEAMRRPGRFDQELEICIPNAIQRYEIIKALLNNVPNTIPDHGIRTIANAAHAYVGADLYGAIQEASLIAISRCISLRNGLDGDASPCMEFLDLQKGLGNVKPSAMREVYVEVPQVYWKDVGGQADIKQKLIEAVAWPLHHADAFARFGIRPPRETKVNFISIKGPELYSKYVGESEKAVRDTFKRARAAAPSIVFFDEIDAMCSCRGASASTTDGSSSDRVLAQLLSEIDGVESMTGVTILAATNRPDILDSALLRPGRIDRVLYVAPPDQVSRLEILHVRTRNMALTEDVDLERIADMTHKFSGAEVVAVCQEAAMRAMDENIQASKVAMRHFEHAISVITPRITASMIEFYESFADRSGLSRVL